MPKTYIVYYDFKNTSGNHAGMAYLARQIEKQLTEVKCIRNIRHEFKSGGIIARLYAVFLALYLAFVLKKGDKVFFFEYLTKRIAYQEITAKTLRVIGVKNELVGLVHLAGGHLKELYKDERIILERLNLLDKVFVFGTSLKTYFRNIGFTKPIVKTFHYVDTLYYKPLSHKDSSKLNVICLGNLKRDYKQLYEIIKQLPSVNFHICMGTANLRPIFGEMKNVKLYGFLEENDLLKLMQSCNVGLSVLKDTVGSNVITTSLAVGLVQVVSDVGSIRDYCDEGNSILCTDNADYINGILKLTKDKEFLESLRLNTLQKAQTLSLDSFIKVLKKELTI